MRQPRIGDVWGAVLADALAGKPAREIVERDDGFVMVFDAAYLVAQFKKWDDADERRASYAGASSTSAAAVGAYASIFKNAVSR